MVYERQLRLWLEEAPSLFQARTRQSLARRPATSVAIMFHVGVSFTIRHVRRIKFDYEKPLHKPVWYLVTTV